MVEFDRMEKYKTEESVSSEKSKNSYRPGGFWIRFVAALLDIVIWLVIVAILVFILYTTNLLDIHQIQNSKQEINYSYTILYLTLYIIYYPLAESSQKMQGTLGKYILGLKIVKSDGNRMSFLRAIARHFAKGISFLPLALGFIMVAFNKNKRGLHDIICNTYVVRK